MKTGIVCFFLLFWSSGIVHGQDKKEEYLRKVLSNLEKIESATYNECQQAWEPGDTIPVYTEVHYIEEYNNPNDTTIGASWAEYNEKKMFLWGYDGTVSAHAYHDKKGLMIDDFASNKRPFRPVSPPFFNYVKSIIRYSLTTSDSITTELKDIGDAYHFKMVVHENEQVEFFGKDYRLGSPYILDPTSVYEVWISKENDLPYKKRREMFHSINASSCSEVKLNEVAIGDFNLYDRFPQDYEIRNLGKPNPKHSEPKRDLTGTKAPNWTLRDADGREVSLGDFKSKVLLINFTGIGCGPCKMAVPFLNGLKERFKAEELEVAAIESWGRKLHSVQSYIRTNGINYKLLEGSDEVIKDYLDGNRAVPYYFILDQDRVIRKVVYGYGKGQTDQTITDAIDKLL